MQNCGKQHRNRDRKQIPNDVDTFIEILDQIPQFFKPFFMSLQQKGHKGNQFQETKWITSCCENTIEAAKILVCFFFPPG